MHGSDAYDEVMIYCTISLSSMARDMVAVKAEHRSDNGCSVWTCVWYATIDYMNISSTFRLSLSSSADHKRPWSHTFPRDQATSSCGLP